MLDIGAGKLMFYKPIITMPIMVQNVLTCFSSSVYVLESKTGSEGSYIATLSADMRSQSRLLHFIPQSSSLQSLVLIKYTNEF